jgi:hypothetical protein
MATEYVIVVVVAVVVVLALKLVVMGAFVMKAPDVVVIVLIV